MSGVIVPKHWTIREEEDFVHEEILGRGGFGEVHKIYNPTARHRFARKIIRPWGPVTEEDVKNEVRALNKLCKTGHPNIVQVLDYGQLKSDAAFYFIDMELCGPTLENYLKGRDIPGLMAWTEIREKQEVVTENAYKILQHVINGLVYIHSLGEVHRDLSPQNVLFSHDYWKIADFGLASEATSSRLVTSSAARGKPCYRAPELLQGESVSDNKFVYNNKSDMWSLGCIVFELFTGRKAFLNDYQVFDYANMRKNQKEFVKQLNSDAKFYLQGLLQKEPRERPSAKFLMRRKFRAEFNDSLIRKRKGFSVSEESERMVIPRFLSQTMGWAVLNGNSKAIESILYGIGPVNLLDPPCANAMIRAVFNGTTEAVLDNIPIQDANEALLALWTALSRSSLPMVQLLLLRIPDEHECRLLLKIYTVMWDHYQDMLGQLVSLEVKIGWYDVLNWEALYNLALDRYDNTRAFQIARVMPSNMASLGKDWCVIKTPEPDKRLGVSLLTDVVYEFGSQDLGVVFSPDGKFLGLHSRVHTKLFVHVLEIVTGRKVVEYMIDDKLGTVYALGHNGRQFYIASGGGTSLGALIIQPVGNDFAKFLLGHHSPSITEIYCSPDSARLLSAGSDHTVRLWDYARGTQLKSWDVSGNADFRTLTFSADGKFAVCSQPDDIHVWSTDTEAGAHHWYGNTMMYTNVSIPEGTKTITVGFPANPRSLKALEITTSTRNGTSAITLHPISDPIPDFKFRPREELIGWASSNEWVVTSCIESHNSMYMWRQNKYAFGPKSSGLFACFTPYGVRVWKLSRPSIS